MEAELLNIIDKRFPILEISNKIDCVLLRSSISNSEEALEFFNLISFHTKSDWIDKPLESNQQLRIPTTAHSLCASSMIFSSYPPAFASPLFTSAPFAIVLGCYFHSLVYLSFINVRYE